MAYKAPIWEDGKSPAISAENLNNLSQAAEGAQVLYGNSAPTSSTEGAVGQFYLVVVADGDGNYPLYQCVAIMNGSYVWRDTRRIPDSITSMLGIPAPGTINSALNVLARVGNLHVWERVQTLENGADAVFEEVLTDTSEVIVGIPAAGSTVSVETQYSDSVSIDSSGKISLNSPTTATLTYRASSNGVPTEILGKYVIIPSRSDTVYFIPTTATCTYQSSSVCLNNVKTVTSNEVSPAVPPGTYTDYLTSTDRNAYPDESTDGSDAYYTLGAAGYLNFYYSEYDGSVTWKYSSSISVDDDGTVSLVSPSSTGMTADNPSVSIANNLKGKFVLLSAASNYTDATHGVIYYIPADATISAQVSSTTPWYIQTNKAQPVTGHAAIPSNTIITYLGQLGEPDAKIEVRSYVGTGTYGANNALTISASGEIILLMMLQCAYSGGGFTNVVNAGGSNAVMHLETLSISYVKSYASWAYGSGKPTYAKKSADGKSVSWYSTYDADNQFNVSGATYYYLIIYK